MYKVSSINAIIRAISSRVVAFPCGQRPSAQRPSLIVNRFILRFRFLATPKISFSELEVSDFWGIFVEAMSVAIIRCVNDKVKRHIYS